MDYWSEDCEFEFHYRYAVIAEPLTLICSAQLYACLDGKKGK